MKHLIIFIINIFISGYLIKLAWQEYKKEEKGQAVISSLGSILFIYFAYVRMSEFLIYEI